MTDRMTGRKTVLLLDFYKNSDTLIDMETKYVWIVFDGGSGFTIEKVFDKEKAAYDYANKNATSFSGFDGNYALPVSKYKVESN